MNILLYISAMWPCEHKFRAEAIYKHCNKDDIITILKCNGVFKNCCRAIDTLAPQKAPIGCSKCMQDFSRFIDKYKIPHGAIKFLSFTDCREQPEIPEFRTASDLGLYTYKGADIGAAALNTISNVLFDSNPDVISHKQLVSNFLTSGIHLFNFFDKVLSNFDRVYFWGGRTILERPAIRACEKNNVSYVSYEYGAAPNTFLETRDSLFHNIDYWKPIIDAEWSDAGSEKYIITENFFNQRRGGSQEDSFTNIQQKNMLPTCFNKNKRNIAIFDTSIIETLGLDTFYSKMPPKDFIYIIFIISKILLKNKNISLYFRAHPNIKRFYTSTHNPYIFSTPQKMLRILAALQLENLYIIFPHEKIDTYALMDHCDTILTCGSTIGLEATFWKKPSILLGRAWYEHLDVSYSTSSLEEALLLLEQPNLPPKPKDNTLPYAFYLCTHGHPFTMHPDWQWEKKFAPSSAQHFNVTATILLYRAQRTCDRIQKKLQKWFSPARTNRFPEFAEAEVQKQMQLAEDFYLQPPAPEEFDYFFNEVRRCANVLGISELDIKKIIQ